MIALVFCNIKKRWLPFINAIDVKTWETDCTPLYTPITFKSVN